MLSLCRNEFTIVLAFASSSLCRGNPRNSLMLRAFGSLVLFFFPVGLPLFAGVGSSPTDCAGVSFFSLLSLWLCSLLCFFREGCWLSSKAFWKGRSSFSMGLSRFLGSLAGGFFPPHFLGWDYHDCSLFLFCPFFAVSGAAAFFLFLTGHLFCSIRVGIT